MENRMKELRKVLGMTQQEFADAIGIKRGTISNYELGRNDPIDAVISLICREFSVNEHWLRTGNGDMFQPCGSEALTALVREHGLSHQDAVVIEKFLDLKPEVRAGMYDYFVRVAQALIESDNESDTPVPAGTSLVEAEALYEKSLDFVPSTASSASNTTGDTASDAEADRKKA